MRNTSDDLAAFEKQCMMTQLSKPCHLLQMLLLFLCLQIHPHTFASSVFSLAALPFSLQGKRQIGMVKKERELNRQEKDAERNR